MPTRMGGRRALVVPARPALRNPAPEPGAATWEHDCRPADVVGAQPMRQPRPIRQPRLADEAAAVGAVDLVMDDSSG